MYIIIASSIEGLCEWTVVNNWCKQTQWLHFQSTCFPLFKKINTLSDCACRSNVMNIQLLFKLSNLFQFFLLIYKLIRVNIRHEIAIIDLHGANKKLKPIWHAFDSWKGGFSRWRRIWDVVFWSVGSGNKVQSSLRYLTAYKWHCDLEVKSDCYFMELLFRSHFKAI